MKNKLIFEAFHSPIGMLYIIFLGKQLTKITMDKPRGIRAGVIPNSFKQELKAYFEGRLREFKQEVIFLEGTDFEKKVWLALKDVPYGETMTYKRLAEKAGTPQGQRAVGQALSKNPIPIVLPCHRIIESDGHIGGYSQGVNIKRRLLEMEYYMANN